MRWAVHLEDGEERCSPNYPQILTTPFFPVFVWEILKRGGKAEDLGSPLI